MAAKRDSNPIDELRSYASGLVDAVPPLETSSLHLVEGSPIPKRPHRFTVPAIAAMSVAAMLLVAEVGVAVVANSAVPGDQIYGIDLLVEDALTSVGVPVDTASERFAEAEVLLARNELNEAIRTARVGYREMDQAVVGMAFMHLIQAETSLASNTSPEVDTNVRASFGALLETTRDAGVIEAGDARAVGEAALKVAQAAASGEEDSS